jgi:hypothetical protein
MFHYIVFAGQKSTGFNRTYMNWQEKPVGVFRAESAESACRLAAKKNGRMGTYFAVEGFPWGVEMFDADDASELGVENPLSKLEQLENRSRELEKLVLEKENKDA